MFRHGGKLDAGERTYIRESLHSSGIKRRLAEICGEAKRHVIGFSLKMAG